MIFVHLEEATPEGNQQDLQCDDDEHDDQEEFAAGNTFENVELVLDLAAAQKVEHLQEHERVEYEGEVPAAILIFLEPLVVVIRPWNCVKFAIGDSGLRNSIVVLGRKIIADHLIEMIPKLGDERRPIEQEH